MKHSHGNVASVFQIMPNNHFLYKILPKEVTEINYIIYTLPLVSA